jgi:hypothetical protein
VCSLAAIALFPARAACQQTEIQQLLLNIEKLNQFRQILSNMYKGYQILSEGYTKIKEITSGNYTLHQVFLDGLLAVSPNVRSYKRIADIINTQLAILNEYKSAYTTFRESGQFSATELADMYAVYKNLTSQSMAALDELTMIITSGTLRMDDNERLSGIDRINQSMEEKLVFLRDFNRQYGRLALYRGLEQKDISTVKELYNIK